jgi:hypothetical protein
MSASDEREEYMNVSITVKSKAEAEKMKSNFESKPDGVYRAVLFSVTGQLEFLS